MRSHDAEAPAPAVAFEKLKVALISVGAALFLISAKAAVGFLTGSLAILAEAVHSSLDLFASLVTALSVKAADRPPDQSHHYGHGKIESLSALFEAVVLLLTCLWIFSEAIHRMISSSSAPEVNGYSFAVMFVAIAVDFSRYRILIRTARKYHSQALEADAIHFYSDILSSSLVLFGLGAVSLGYYWADAAAALAVAVWVGILSIRLAKKNLDVLIDRVPEGYLEQIHALVLSFPGVENIEKLRLRRSGATLFADLRVEMDRTLSFSQAHRLAGDLEKALADQISGLDAIVHMDPAIEPDKPVESGVFHFIRLQGLQAHHISLRRVSDHYHLELHLEMPGKMTIGEAHRQATDFEVKLLNRFPEIAAVNIHIEEIDSAECVEIPCNEEHPDIISKIHTICAAIIGKEQCHAVTLGSCAGILNASMHCVFPEDLTVTEVHRMTTRLEEELLHSIPELDRVLIHAEPLTRSTV